MYIPYSGRDWQVESLANMANHLQFAKLKASKVVVTINNPLADLFIHQTFSAKCLKRVNSPNILPAKLSRYTVYNREDLYCLYLTIINFVRLFFTVSLWKRAR